MLDFVNYLAKEAVEEFKEYNKRREKQILSPMKRLGRQSLEKVADTLFNKLDIKNTDKAGLAWKILKLDQICVI